MHIDILSFAREKATGVISYGLVDDKPIATLTRGEDNIDIERAHAAEVLSHILRQQENTGIARALFALSDLICRVTLYESNIGDEASSRFLAIEGEDDRGTIVASMATFGHDRIIGSDRVFDRATSVMYEGELVESQTRRIPIEPPDINDKVADIIDLNESSADLLNALLRRGATSSQEIDDLLDNLFLYLKKGANTEPKRVATLRMQLSGYGYQIMHATRQTPDKPTTDNITSQAHTAISHIFKAHYFNPNGELG